MRASRSFAVAIAVGCAAFSAPARAQDAAAAKVLFTQGLADMQAGKLDTGCPALEESYRLDPRAGTLFTLAECENHRGRLATAVARYDDYLALVGRLPPDQQQKQGGRVKAAQDQKAALDPLVPALTLSLPPGAPRDTVVKRDGTTLAGPALGLALPVDPGEHVITVQAPGGPLNEVRVTLGPGDRKQITLDLKPAAVSAPTPPPGLSPPPKASVAPAPSAKADVAPPSGARGRRVGAYVAGGLGVAGLAIGAVMGGITIGKKAVIQKDCGVGGDPTACHEQGFAAASDAKTTSLVSTVGFAVGGAGVVTALVLLLTESKRAPGPSKGVQAGALSVGRDGATLGLRGAW